MIDGVPATEDKLQIGMVVKVRGTIDDATQTGTATLVEASNVLAGKIDDNGVDLVNNTITVLGQTVRIEDNVTRLNDDNITTVKTFTAASFAPGERVEVHGVLDDLGGLRATRVVKKTTGEFQVKGFVVSTGSPFVLSLTPDGLKPFSVTGTLPAGAVVGSIVEVHATAAPVGGAVTATLVKLEDNIGVAGEKVEVEGIVTSGDLVNGNSFVVNGQKVVTSAATLFEGGLKADFAVGVKVEAEGPLDANGAIVAVKVMFRSNIKIEGIASGVTATGLTLLNKNIAINKYTRLDVIANGNQVEVRAVLDRDGNLIATRVVNRGNVDGKAFLQGPVTAFNATAGTMTILGVPIQAASAQFRISNDIADVPVPNPADFFAKLTANVTVVKVRWDAFTATTVAVNQAEIQLGK
jgi:hypothetical protein